MAIVTISASEIVGAYDASGNVDLTDVATGLLNWGSIRFNMLQTPSILRTELSNQDVLITDDRRGTWSKIKAVRDKILADIS